PLAKRRRTDDSDATRTPVTRSAEYWFDDGNIILQVESTQFRVAKSVLSMHSSVFRDMFALPLPADEPTIENCPVVVLSGDTAKDWVVLLGALYPKRLVEEEALHLNRIAAILRLSKKYDFPLFRKDSLKKFKTEFPTTLEEFDALDQWPFENTHMYPTAISLAKEIGVHSVLPLAYILLLDNSMPVLNPSDADLDASDRFACLLGYANLLELQASETFAWLNLEEKHIPSPSCRQSSKCTAALKDVAFNMSTKDIRPRVWILQEWEKEWEAGMCELCRKKAKKVYEASSETCWQRLPSMFGLPGWQELRSLDFE
ncbi:hypothetical protein C8F04DRAFT_1361149, partial [Mycena alexandri]